MLEGSLENDRKFAGPETELRQVVSISESVSGKKLAAYKKMMAGIGVVSREEEHLNTGDRRRRFDY